MAKRDYGWAIPLPPQSSPNAWSGEDQPPSYEETLMTTPSHLFQTSAPPVAAFPPYPAYPTPYYPPLPAYTAPDDKSSERRQSFEVQHATPPHYRTEQQTKPSAPPLPPPKPPTPPQRPHQGTKGTAMGTLSTNSSKAEGNSNVYGQQSTQVTQGLRPHRPPPPPPTRTKTLTRQDTFDAGLLTEESLYVNPEELNPKCSSVSIQEPLYIEVLPATEPHRPPLHHSASDNPRAPRPIKSPLTPPLPAERQLHHQLSLPARLPRGLENVHRVSKEELDILLEWWNTVKETEPVSHQMHENNIKEITNDAHRVRLALHLFEGLFFYRGQIFNDHITQLYCMADKLDDLHKKTKIAGIASGTTGAIGGAAIVAGAVLAPLTFGVTLAVAAVGVGVAAAGGVTGASVAIKNKMFDTKERKKVEELMQTYRTQMEEVEACLKFISTGLESLRKYNLGAMRGMETDAVRVLRLAQVVSSQSFHLRPTGRASGILDGFAMSMDMYFTKEDKEKLKKGSETKFARKIRELAKQLKAGLDELVQVRDTIRSAVQKVVIR